MNPKYKEALSEVDYIINKLENEEIEKIPGKFREFIKNNKSKTHSVNEIENLAEETYAILAFIYRKYLSPIEEREKLEKEFLDKLKKEKELLKYNKVNYEISYSSHRVIADDEENVKENECTDIGEYVQDKWYKRLFYKIKCLVSYKFDR